MEDILGSLRDYPNQKADISLTMERVISTDKFGINISFSIESFLSKNILFLEKPKNHISVRYNNRFGDFEQYKSTLKSIFEYIQKREEKGTVNCKNFNVCILPIIRPINGRESELKYKLSSIYHTDDRKFYFFKQNILNI